MVDSRVPSRVPGITDAHATCACSPTRRHASAGRRARRPGRVWCWGACLASKSPGFAGRERERHTASATAAPHPATRVDGDRAPVSRPRRSTSVRCSLLRVPGASSQGRRAWVVWGSHLSGGNRGRRDHLRQQHPSTTASTGRTTPPPSSAPPAPPSCSGLAVRQQRGPGCSRTTTAPTARSRASTAQVRRLPPRLRGGTCAGKSERGWHRVAYGTWDGQRTPSPPPASSASPHARAHRAAVELVRHSTARGACEPANMLAPLDRHRRVPRLGRRFLAQDEGRPPRARRPGSSGLYGFQACPFCRKVREGLLGAFDLETKVLTRVRRAVRASRPR